jgi:hypothetical protein
VLIELAGGLGNQMFQYTLGQVFAKKFDAELILDVSQIGVGGTNHGIALKNFQLRDNVRFVTLHKKPLGKFLERVNNSLSHRSSTFRRLNSRAFYQSTDAGYDEKVLSLNLGKRIKGYYQSFRYADLIRDELIADFQLTEPSEWFLMTEEIAAKENPTMIHVRRGDYLNLKNDFGVLSGKYYAEACAQIAIRNGESNKWIFSDSPELMSELMESSGISNWKIIVPPSGISPNESLKLMSTARNLIMSNSTFSWWSAYLNSEPSSVYAPSHWFKNRVDPIDLLPSRWLKIPSVWEH